MDERRQAASFVAGMQIAYADLQELTETLAAINARKHLPPTPQTARAVRVDLERIRQLLDRCRQYVDEIECTSVGF